MTGKCKCPLNNIACSGACVPSNNDKNCGGCGNNLSPAARFCASCGTPRGEGSSSPSESSSTSNPPARNVPVSSKTPGSAKCMGCDEVLDSGEYVKLPGGIYHRECFICAVCKVALVDKKGYVFWKNYYLCGMQCRRDAVANPDALPKNMKAWHSVAAVEVKAGWKREDGREGEDTKSKIVNPMIPVKVLPSDS